MGVIDIPVEVDGIEMGTKPRECYARLVACLEDQAGWGRTDAIRLALPAFRKAFVLEGDEWKARKTIELAGARCCIEKSVFWRHCQAGS